MPKEVNNDLTLVSTVAANVRRLMRARNMRAVELAEKMDCSRQYIYLIKEGRGNVTLESLEKLAEAFAVKPGDLLRKPRPKKVPSRLETESETEEQDAVIA